MLETNQIAELAARLRTAGETGVPIPPLRDELAGSIESAYAVQLRNLTLRIERGDRLVGRKIGLTSEAVQQQLGVDQPDFGGLLASMRIGNDGVMEFDAVLQPRIEAEVAFVLAESIDDPGVSLAELTSAVDHLLPALEIVGSRIANWDIKFLDTVADNASSGMFVLGDTPVDPSSVDLVTAEMSLLCNGEQASSGVGAACLGSPYHAALWLARKMAELGAPLQAGDVILTGALGPMVDFGPEAHITAHIDGVGSVAVTREGASS